MKALIWFHHLLFFGMLMLAFWAGALNAGRKDMLEDAYIEKLLRMGVTRLSREVV